MFDNHLINNSILSLIYYKDSPYAWYCIDKIRNVVLDFISHDENTNFVLTNYLDGADFTLHNQVLEMSANRNSVFIPIQLTLRQDEHSKRITNSQRLALYKSIDIKHVNAPIIEITHPNLLILDISDLSAQEAYDAIMQHIKNKQS